MIKLSTSNFVCAAYHKSRMVVEKELKYEMEIVEVVDQAFNGVKSARNEDTQLNTHLDKLRTAATRIAKKYSLVDMQP